MILLISEIPEDQGFVNELGKNTKMRVVIEKNPTSALGKLNSSDTVIFFDCGSENQLEEFVKIFSARIGHDPQKIHPNFVHAICPKGPGPTNARAHSDYVSHFVFRDAKNQLMGADFYARVVNKFCVDAQRKSFKDLLSPGAEIVSFKPTHSSQRQTICTDMESFLTQKAELTGRVATIVVNAIDELLMNAIYDAPCDENGNQIYAKVPRTTPIDLTGRHAVELQMGYDENYCAISVVDQFGSLSKTAVISHAFKEFVSSGYEVDQERAGAGLGLMLTIQSGVSLVFSAEHNKKTEVVAFFKRTKSFSEFKGQFKVLSFYETQK